MVPSNLFGDTTPLLYEQREPASAQQYRQVYITGGHSE